MFFFFFFSILFSCSGSFDYLQVSDNIELLCIFLYFIVFCPFVNLFSVIYMMKDVENVS